MKVALVASVALVLSVLIWGITHRYEFHTSPNHGVVFICDRWTGKVIEH